MAVRTRVNHSAIAGMFLPGGQIYAEADRIRYWSQAYAKATAPKRSGALARSIKSDRWGTNQHQSQFNVFTTVEYGRYVSEGTGRINIGKPMVLYQGPRFVQPRWLWTKGWLVGEVAGQDANNFLERGMRRAMRRFGYL